MASTPKISNRTPLIPNNVLELAQQTLTCSVQSRLRVSLGLVAGGRGSCWFVFSSASKKY